MSKTIRSKNIAPNTEFCNEIANNQKLLKAKQKTLSKLKAELGNMNMIMPMANQRIVQKKIENLKTQLEKQQENKLGVTQYGNLTNQNFQKQSPLVRLENIQQMRIKSGNRTTSEGDAVNVKQLLKNQNFLISKY
ncbi:unnamed protein product (macronuclear) [Paramecium tetraurelia]|uniref:Uncharacterized protein n=1 Tax=Paramecium tetraurelia TaxID=5888 RepID=A0DGE9_PARTE|nr:uncharacterized protein GSPATT00002245001 [Paramecium tetraurelia]CAK82116.1 unnamed protein product [Paramecium tetraurelia]|eukprot:XP_001449513.1 hypothetical protein (macronuclear) [Paramecium tetraurelia strain d4-2]